ncbi:MAG: hypothetical protein LBS54_00105 [Dysgonamonadaceae bacterium]|jgi:hypothetical protein|nr:hypothetical protein [Dysgonamonadaceae bacterium]
MARKKKYYLPAKYADLLAWLKNFIDCIAANRERFGVPEDVFDDLRNKSSAFQLAQDKAEQHNAGPVDRLVRKEAADVVKKAARDVVNRYLKYNPDVTDADKRKLGITIPDDTKTPVEVPKTHPVFVLKLYDFMRISIQFHDQILTESDDKTPKARPYGVNGAVVKFATLEQPPKDHTGLGQSDLATRSPHILSFDAEDRGKTAYIAMAWQNEKGEKGPWTLVQSIIVP